jgi:hypothetical protein
MFETVGANYTKRGADCKQQPARGTGGGVTDPGLSSRGRSFSFGMAFPRRRVQQRPCPTSSQRRGRRIVGTSSCGRCFGLTDAHNSPRVASQAIDARLDDSESETGSPHGLPEQHRAMLGLSPRPLKKSARSERRSKPARHDPSRSGRRMRSVEGATGILGKITHGDPPQQEEGCPGFLP